MASNPSSIDAERAVLSAMICDGRQAAAFVGELCSEYFSDERHKQLFDLLMDMNAKQKHVDIITVSETISDDKVHLFGGRSYVAGVAAIGASAINIEHHSRIVIGAYKAKRVLAVATELAERVRSDPYNETLSSQAAADLLQIEAVGARGGPEPAKEICKRVLLEIEQERLAGKPPGVMSGLADMDMITHGFRPGEFVLLGARPSMGKTALALTLSVGVGDNSKKTILFFSMEMSKESLIRRLICSLGNVSATGMISAQIRPQDWPRIGRAIQQISEGTLWIDDTSTLTVAQIRSRALRVHIANPLGMIAVDYLQLMRGEGHSREQEVSSISRGLKLIAMELNIPVLVLCQLNRELEKREDKRPRLSDLRESGSLEQDADIATFLYRPYAYNPREDPSLVEVGIEKGRNCGTGRFKLQWTPEMLRFTDWRGK